MELDKRIKEGKKPFDCVDAESETVKSFIGKKGYFANHISEFIDISDLEEDVLTAINPDEPDCEVYKATCTTWEYFLPAEWVKEPEKKYRPFNLQEFVNKFDVGKVVCFRHKIRKEMDKVAYAPSIRGLVTSIEYHRDNPIIRIADTWYSLERLFEDYELYDKELGWIPFGVKVNG